MILLTACTCVDVYSMSICALSGESVCGVPMSVYCMFYTREWPWFILLVVHSWGNVYDMHACIHFTNCMHSQEYIDLLRKELIMHANTGRHFTMRCRFKSLQTALWWRKHSMGVIMQLSILLGIGELSSFVKEIGVKSQKYTKFKGKAFNWRHYCCAYMHNPHLTCVRLLLKHISFS